MAKSKLVMAVDIGTTKIAAIVGKVFDSGKVVVIAQKVVQSQGVRRGMVENVTETVTSIRQCLEQLKEQTDISQLREVSVGIAGRHITSTQNSTSIIRSQYTDPISSKELEDLQKQMYHMALKPGQEILHVIPQDYTIDGSRVLKAEGCVGNKLTANYHIVIGEVSAIETIKMCIKKSGLTLRKLVLEPLASADAVLTSEEKEEGVAMLDIGGGTSDLIIYHQNIVQSTTVIPCGGEVITDDIRVSCNISRNKAEYIKREYGSCFYTNTSADEVITFPTVPGHDPRKLSFRTLAGITQARMDQIIEAVLFKIEESGLENTLHSIVLTGGGSLLRDLPQLVKFRSGLDTRIGIPTIQVENHAEAKRVNPALATAVGLVISGYYDEKVGRKSRDERTGFFPLTFGKRAIDRVKVMATERLDKLFEEKDKPMI
ncbi:MAG: cell division protein FtsA [Prevotellaceae bacterium]|jgi:cell division protein FtsA|nr:cell division protein FtsA [Prevotellaceae bacterium]